MGEISLAEFKRRAAACATFEVVNHLHPHRTGPRTVVEINPKRIRSQREGDTARTWTEWPKAGLCRIEGNSITFLGDMFTFTFPFPDGESAVRQPPTEDACQKCGGVDFLARASELAGAPALCTGCHEKIGTAQAADGHQCVDGCPRPVDHSGLCLP
ncbi:hypothetical protein [Kitasatospora sp. NPDC088548]|uniref:hypothetical protein n=1 Tax=Kitasatospora sp. NPDC088548 TaxID=3364075 RepID=UPI0037FC74DB